MRTLSAVLFILTIFLAGCGGSSGGSSGGPAPTPTPTSTAWQSLAPMPTARHALGLATVGGRLYAIGGFGVGGQVVNNEEYDPAANTWRLRNPLPSTATDFAGTNAAVVNDTIYMIGGNASGFCTSMNRAYTPATDTWATRAPMPTARCHLAVVAVNGLIYAIGGTNTSGSTNFGTVEVYNPATNTWTTAASMPTPRSVIGAGVANSRIHVFGGSGGPTTHERYDPATNLWSTRASMPTGRSGVAVAQVNVNGFLYVVGGIVSSTSTWLTTVEAYDPASDTWQTSPIMPTRRASPGATVLNGLMYVIGGYGDANVELTTNEAFNP